MAFIIKGLFWSGVGIFACNAAYRTFTPFEKIITIKKDEWHYFNKEIVLSGREYGFSRKSRWISDNHNQFYGFHNSNLKLENGCSYKVKGYGVLFPLFLLYPQTLLKWHSQTNMS